MERGPSKYESEEPRHRPSPETPEARGGPERLTGVTATVALARQAGLSREGWPPDRHRALHCVNTRSR